MNLALAVVAAEFYLLMFEGWSYSQVLRVIGQSLEERGVQDFLLLWQEGEFVLHCKRVARLEQRWLDKFLGQKVVYSEHNVEIRYSLKSIVWLQIRGEAMRKDANQVPDYFRLSQTLRTVGNYAENRTMPLVSLGRVGGICTSSLKSVAARNGSKSMAWDRLRIIFCAPTCATARLARLEAPRQRIRNGTSRHDRYGSHGFGAVGAAQTCRRRRRGVLRRPCAALEDARKLGFTPVASVAAVANRATLIDVVVRTDQDILDCMLGADGLIQASAPGTLVLLHSSILPQTVKTVEAAARAKAIHVIDACMTGVPDTVRAGKLSFVVGGADELVERATPHLLKMSQEVFHMGPVGTGAVGKLIKNMLGGAETLIVHEAIQIGIAGGIPYPKALEMMRRIGHDSLLNRWQRTFDPSGSGPLPKAGRNILNKDIPLVAELARLLKTDTPITEQLAAAAGRVVSANEKRIKP